MTQVDDLAAVAGCRLDAVVPRPVPWSYRRLRGEERAGRGRAAIRLWVMGFTPRAAWGFALASRFPWRRHLPDAYEGRSVEVVLLGDVVARRLRDVRDAEDWYQAMVAER